MRRCETVAAKLERVDLDARVGDGRGVDRESRVDVISEEGRLLAQGWFALDDDEDTFPGDTIRISQSWRTRGTLLIEGTVLELTRETTSKETLVKVAFRGHARLIPPAGSVFYPPVPIAVYASVGAMRMRGRAVYLHGRAVAKQEELKRAARAKLDQKAASIRAIRKGARR